MAKKKVIEFDSCRKYQKKDENMHIYANLNQENELILLKNSEFYRKQPSNGIE
jgi:hypothetical protein